MSKSNLLVFDLRKNSKEKPFVKVFIKDEELEQKYLSTWNTHMFILIKNYHGLSILKSQITNFIKKMVL